MEISIKSAVLLAAILLTGLSAGLFYAWQVSVIPGTRRVADVTYLETMQSINRAILNPAFFLIFLGSLVMLTVSTVQQYSNEPVFGWVLAAAVVYAIGTFGITAFGNVPLNDMLDALDLAQLSAEKISETRSQYEGLWNRYHLIRTICSVLSFLLALLAVFK
ncbi:anthrone oxygenase family protein [Flavilitoribacter nigricans]|uniref:DUF1772 domain-containing protein n=1 Tax=Flavilitoribacter nigricans (strain ATCC 23147 / DSM 23189 / NBRC 102662 / NCIMB 1420 / SS-2) TaxID=1122177 RepID=A0A2D0N394_FLAN2|nr:DUF1772 domain-containing protein [Flavilitoribacter nigricans]PHN02991.1 hypothetical protein CRP01_29755 [Flavilitoribacter nigricans DSM 23189 = NBRC 102662]